MKIADLLTRLEDELKANALWQATRPSEVALSSLQPFCIDTLSFEQWLQFVLIDRFKALLAMGMQLPNNISVCPMAEETFKHLGDDASELINIIADIDEHLSGKRVQTLYVRK